VRLFIDTRRIARVELAEATNALVDESSRPAEAVGATIDLQRALDALSRVERLCVVLKLGEGLSHADIVEISGMPEGTVKSHVHRGLAKARKFLGEGHE